MLNSSIRYLGTWHAPDITPGNPGWDHAALVDYLRTGHAGNGATAGGPMREAIDKSFSKMAPQDIAAVATCPQALPPTAHAALPPPVAVTVAARDIDASAGSIGSGERLYRNNCASCHQIGGGGVRGLPALRNHPVLRQPNADNVAMAILEGVWPEEGQGMPGFAAELTDRDVAEVTNYVVQEFGNNPVRIDANRIRALREGGAASPLLMLARVGMACAALLLVLALPWVRRRRRIARAS